MLDADKATSNEDTNETEEEDPIIEDVSRVDLTNLEVVSRWFLLSDENIMTYIEVSLNINLSLK